MLPNIIFPPEAEKKGLLPSQVSLILEIKISKMCFDRKIVKIYIV